MSGPGLHYSHKLPWSILADVYRTYQHPAVTLPVGECKKIHIANKKIKHQVKNAAFLQNNVCTNPHCTTVVGESEFRKSMKFTDKLFTDRTIVSGKRQAVREEFFNKFVDAVFDYIATVKSSDVADDAYPIDYPKGDHELCRCDDCDKFIMLMETKNITALQKYGSDQLLWLFQCRHGGQGVGENLRFLFYHVWRVYFVTNIIFASNSTEKTSNWGMMELGSYSRRELMYSCDGQTFLPNCRKYLTEDVYLRDLKATKELCKRCFEFICIYTMMELKIRPRNETEIVLYDGFI